MRARMLDNHPSIIQLIGYLKLKLGDYVEFATEGGKVTLGRVNGEGEEREVPSWLLPYSANVLEVE